MTHTLEQWLDRYESGAVNRRAFLTGVAALIAAAPGDAQAQAPVTGSGLHHVEIKTIDLARSSAFYRKLFGVSGETRADDRVILPFGSGASKGYLTIGRGPIPRVDHFSVKVPAMHPKDPKATAARLSSAGFKARQAGSSVYVMDPDGFEVEVQAPSTVP